MSTSVKISESCKRILERLQARLVLTYGKKVSQQELLDEILRAFAEREEELIQRIAGVKLPLSPDETERLLKTPVDWGIETREEELNKYLYSSRGSCE
jgi:chorismate mutase